MDDMVDSRHVLVSVLSRFGEWGVATHVECRYTLTVSC